MIKFLFIGLLSSVIVAGVSLLWPRFSLSPRPAPLEAVRSVVLGTQAGKDAAVVLGVSDPSTMVPINPVSMAQSAVQSVITTVETRTQQVVVENAVRQLSTQFNNLPTEEKQQIQTIICKP